MEGTKAAELRKNQKSHPYERANIFKRMFFCWMFPVFHKGLKQDLNEEDLFPPANAHESGRLGRELEKAWNGELKHSKDPSLWRALFKVFWKQLAINILFFTLHEFILKLTQPIALSKLLSYYEPNSTVTMQEAYIASGVIILDTFFLVMMGHSYMMYTMHLGMKIRVAVCSLIYKKALRLSKSALAQTTIGQMTNLLSNDVARFDVATVHISNVFLTPFHTIFVMGLLYSYFGATALVGVCFLLLFVPFQMWMGKKTSIYRLRTAIRTDERIRLMNEIVSGIQVIKMYTWEKPFAKLVEISRIKEMKEIKKMSVIRAVLMSFNIFVHKVSIYLCILTYVLTGNVPNSQYVFVLSMFYTHLRQGATDFFPKGITNLAESNISVRRIKQFLMYEEIGFAESNPRFDLSKSVTTSLEKISNNGFLQRIKVPDESIGVHLRNVSVKWVQSSSDNSLNNINFAANSNELVAIVGPVGSGKSTLLHVILQELPPVTGTAKISGTLSYASQEPWLFGGTIKQNIIFGRPFDYNKYKDVVRVCALHRDFTLFQYGDNTIVGDRGVTLSGGQKARINLARAVYQDADIYLLDDPLSAVDTHVGKQLFNDCITGYLKNKCVVLVTHQLQYLTNTKKIYLIESGKIEAQGTFEQLQNHESEFVKFLNKHDDENEENEEEKYPNTNDTKAESLVEPEEEREGRAVGNISWEVYKSYILAGGHWLKIVILLLVFLVSQITVSSCDYFLTLWVNVVQTSQVKSGQESYFDPKNYTEINVNTDDSFLGSFMSEENCLTVYSTLVGLLVCFTIFTSITSFKFCMKASVRLHNNMFNKIVYAPMKFFNTNSLGRILNRFSRDVGLIDEMLPFTLIDTLRIGIEVVAISAIVAVVNPWMLIPTVVILTIFYIMRAGFLATSRDVKRLEGIMRSPIFQHLTSSLQGLTTIRAFGAEKILTEEFDHHQNLHSAAYFMFLGAVRTFGFWLDIHCVIYISLVTLSFLFLQNDVFGGNVGLALTQSLALTGMFQWGMRQWSELENLMTCVERVKEYSEIQPETKKDCIDAPKDWPKHGNIVFKDLSLRYGPDDPYVLKNLNFSVRTSEKIGIVGRTGAGKSTLISALFRLTDIEGKILIDDVNTKEITLNSLRAKISIIPQEPVLFTGSLRKNLDPFDEYSDEVLWSALEEVELKSVVMDMPQGLETRMSEGGSNFSVGQRQLVCLGRAIIRDNKILVMDEATANVDPYTDMLIQTTIRNKFAHCTVLTIAHRLHTIMDSDRVLVMDAGRVAEYDYPYVLLQNKTGVLYELVQQTGKATAANLVCMAKETFMQKTLIDGTSWRGNF